VRRILLTVTMMVVGALLLGSGQVLAKPGHSDGDGKGRFPDVIALPDGFRPEGISIGRGTSFYVGSLGDGSIYRGDLRTGKGSILVPGVVGRVAAGTEVDDRNRLWVAGGANGTGRVYDAKSGAELADFEFAAPGESFINDVVVTKNAAYFTNSRKQELYVVPLGRGGRISDDFEPLALTGDMVLVPDGFNANGIEASPDGRTLLIVQSATGLLFKVDPRSGVTSQVDLGGYVLTNGDGLLRRGSTLYVVQNRSNLIAVIALGRNYEKGRFVRAIEDADFDVPATVAGFGDYLYAVNARFTTTPTPTTEYTVVKVSAKR